MDISASEKIMLQRLWSREAGRNALKKLIVNALGESNLTVKELGNIWQYIDTQLPSTEDEEESRGNDGTE